MVVIQSDKMQGNPETYIDLYRRKMAPLCRTKKIPMAMVEYHYEALGSSGWHWHSFERLLAVPMINGL